MIPVSGYALIALGIAHTFVGFILYRAAIVDMWRNGVFNAAAGHADRLLAFWFLLFSATLLLLGQLTLYADRAGDATLLRTLTWYVATVGTIGVVILPRSPFWFAIIIAVVLEAARTPG